MQISQGIILLNTSLPVIPGMDVMSSSKYPHIGIIERVSRTEFTWYHHRHRRQVIVGPIFEWNSIEIPYFIWGGDYRLSDETGKDLSMYLFI
ncbi:unnamed protein product [Thelazia callipaeda]|uniref:Peptidase_C39_2 domain-containing protein n=1 Tax=Thelazia callipaeda TaxID=103827 RepID=A0A0N5DB53_THECL|nr:unnamed protein product [Thelazia callipaeda]